MLFDGSHHIPYCPTVKALFGNEHRVLHITTQKLANAESGDGLCDPTPYVFKYHSFGQSVQSVQNCSLLSHSHSFLAVLHAISSVIRGSSVDQIFNIH